MQHGYYVTRLSEHMGHTPEGYLVAKDVPLARTGWQDYLGREIAPNDSAAWDSKVQVYRPEEEVFHPDTLASFEGKTVTDTHPQDWVSPDNDSIYNRGHVQNVRRGSGELKDCMLGDLVIKDPVLINKVKNGLREVSCGYHCTYEPLGGEGSGKYVQRGIRGNHVAVVNNGRAGDRVAIRDSKPELLEQLTQRKARTKGMKINFKTLLGLGLKEYAKDAEPEDLAEAHKMAADVLKESDQERQEAEDKRMRDAAAAAELENKTAMDGDPKEDRILALLEKMLPVLEGIANSQKAVAEAAPKPKEPEEQLDEFAKAFGGKETPEEEAAEAGGAGEEAQDNEFEQLRGAGEAPFRDAEMEGCEFPEVEAAQVPKNPIPGAGADARAVRDAIAALKPVIAAMPNKQEKQKAVDALIGAFRQHRPAARTNGGNNYGKLLHLQRDSASEKAQVGEELGNSIKDKYHRKLKP